VTGLTQTYSTFWRRLLTSSSEHTTRVAYFIKKLRIHLEINGDVKFNWFNTTTIFPLSSTSSSKGKKYRTGFNTVSFYHLHKL